MQYFKVGSEGRAPATPPFSRAKKYFFIHNIGLDEREGVDKKATKNDIGKRACSQNMIFLFQIHLCTFFFNSIFPPWFLMKL